VLSARGACDHFYHLPQEKPGELGYEVVSTDLLECSEKAPEKVSLKDVWGKTLFSLKLPPLGFFDLSTPLQLPSGSEKIPSSLKVSRTTSTEDGVLASLSDGTERSCSGVLFADGVNSQCRPFWTKPAKWEQDKDSVRCWSFRTENLIGEKDWGFRWSPAKSIELLPLPQNKLHVNLRFKSPYGGDLSAAELRELFGEFGSDMTALLENLEIRSVSCREERSVERPVFHPAPGCFALGRAAFGKEPFLTFDWLQKFVDSQLTILGEQWAGGSLNGESFAAQSKERMGELSQAELFLRKHLHQDGVLLRSLRNLLLTVIPQSFLRPRIRSKLWL